MGELFLSYLLTIWWFLGVFDDHYCESTLFWLIIGLKAKSWVWKGSFFKHYNFQKRVECR